MRGYYRHKLFCAAFLAGMVLVPFGMAWWDQRDIFPLFTWSLYSFASNDKTTFFELELQDTSSSGKTLNGPKFVTGPKAFARVQAFGRAVEAGDRAQASRILRIIFKTSNLDPSDTARVRLDRIVARPVDYITNGGVIARSAVNLTLAGLK